MAFNTEYADQIHRHVVIWLDKYIGIVGNNEIMKERFRRVTYPLHTFTDINSTVAFIHEQERAGMAVFLIVSGELAHEIVPLIYPFECLVYVFIFCLDMMKHKDLASEYLDKVLMHDSDEDLLIQLTDEIARQLVKDAKNYEEQDRIELAIGLYDWAAWLCNDVNTLRNAVCERYRQIIQQHQERLRNSRRATIPNRFHSEGAAH